MYNQIENKLTDATDNTNIKMPLVSHDITEERRQQLLALFPDATTEGRIDFDRLRAALGEAVADKHGPERYELTWAGKNEARRALQSLSPGTLRPQPDQSVNFDTTENLIIEGDNLEVLKLLQKSYHGKVKMIYIDPPYNTGKEFIYPDRFQEGLRDYLTYSRQMNGDGMRASVNTESGGRFHSNWLNMMFPRLFLAKNLLKDDGVIFISIDDNEVHNLRSLMNEVFGSENFLGQISVVGNRGGRDYLPVAVMHEYILCYGKDEADTLNELPKPNHAFTMNDSNGGYVLRELRNRNPRFNRSNRPNLHFPIFINQQTVDEYGCCAVSLSPKPGYEVQTIPVNSVGVEGAWRWGRAKFADNIVPDQPANSQVVARQKSDGDWNIYEKSRRATYKVKSVWDEAEVRSERGTIAFRTLFGESVFDHPKPVELVEKCLRLGTDSNDIVLDFFAGSGTTAQAVLELNRDGGDRKFILVQLPEQTDLPDYPTIADITKERVRRVIAKMNADDSARLPLDNGGATAETTPADRGFKVFTLDSSNFKEWNPNLVNAAGQPDLEVAESTLVDQLRLHANNLVPGRTQGDVLTEILLKAGYPLTEAAQPITLDGDKPNADGSLFRVANGRLVICLENPVDAVALREAIASFEPAPTQVICLDAAFEGQDTVKTNLRLELQECRIKFHTV